MNEIPYQAHFGGELAIQEGVMMWMPGGLHTINASRNGKPETVTILVQRGDEKIAQETFEMLKASSPQRPWFDFDHDNKAASGWPLGFFWSDSPQPGIYTKVELTEAGRQGISGKNYRAFSPNFFASKGTPKRLIVPKQADLNMGGFVNEPAFEKILPFWAKRAIQPVVSEPTKNQDPMNDQELAALKAKRTTAETELAGLKAAKAGPELISAKESEIAGFGQQIAQGELIVQNAALQAKLTAQAETRADAAITAAVTRGAIPSKDEAIKAKWRKLILADESALEILNDIPANAAISAGRVVQPGGVVITKEDITNVVRGYQAAASPADRGAFWAANLRARLDTDWQGMIRAANTLGSLSGDLIVQRSLDLLKYEFPLLSMISMDFSEANADLNQTVKTRLRVVPGVSEYDPEEGGYQDEAVTTTDVPVTIDKHVSCQISFNANEVASTKRLLFPEQEEGMHYAIGQELVTAVTGLITAANFAEAPTASALNDFNRRSVIAMKTALNKRKVFGGQRFLLLNSDYHSKLEEDQTIVSMLINKDAGSAIGDSRLPRIARFNPIEADYIPATGNLVGFGGRSDALAMATRLPNDYANVFPGLPQTAVSRVITNPDTGISVMLVQFVDHAAGKSVARIAIMYGKAKGNPKSGQRLVSAVA